MRGALGWPGKGQWLLLSPSVQGGQDALFLAEHAAVFPEGVTWRETAGVRGIGVQSVSVVCASPGQLSPGVERPCPFTPPQLGYQHPLFSENELVNSVECFGNAKFNKRL